MSGLICEFAPGFGPLDVVGALDWVDLSSRLLEASWSEGRDDELEHYGPGQATIVLKNDDRELDPDHASGTWFGELLPRVPFRLREEGSQLRLPGGASASTPDHASFAVTDLDVRVHLSLDDWTPGGFGQTIIGQWGSAGNQSWWLGVAPSGVLALHFTSNGTTDIGASSTAATGFTDGTYHWIRATLDVDNGAAGRDVKFYTSTDGVSWSQLGATVATGGTVTLFDSTSALAISDVLSMAGNVRSAEVRNGIDGTIVAAPDFQLIGAGAKAFVDATGKTWTVNGTAQVVADPATLFDRFYGFVESGFEQELHPPEMALCKVRLTDRLSAVAGLLPDVFEHALMAAGPAGLWVFDGPSGSEEVADLSGGGNSGAAEGTVKFGEPPTTAGHSASALFEASTEQFGRVFIGRSPIIADTGHMTAVASFKVRNASGATNWRTLFAQGNGNAQLTGFQVDVDTNGEPHVVYVEDGLGFAYQPALNVADGQGHLVIAQSNVGFGSDFGLAIDSAVLDTTSGTVAIGSINGIGIGGAPGVQNEDHWDGWIGAVAVYDSTLTLTERQVIVDGYGKLAGFRSDEHIAWALERVGVPVGLMNLDAGTVLMGTADTRGRDALAFIREVVATEQGEFYCDHRDGGKLRFRGRYARHTDSRSTTAQAAFSDDGSNVTAVRVERSGLDVAPNGIDGIVNQADVSWRGGSLPVEDAASAAAFGPQGRSIETQATTAAQARSAGEWLVARYAQPRSRVRGLTINAGASANARTAARRLRVGDRVTYRSHPQQVGSATVIDLFVEGIDHTMGDGTARSAVYHLAPVNTFTPWIWGVSEWDNETFWG